MRKATKYCLLILLFSVLLLSACARRTDRAKPGTSTPAETPSASAEPTPTPVPTPSPIPFELVYQSGADVINGCSSYDELFDSVETIEKNRGEDPWRYFADWGEPVEEIESHISGTRSSDEGRCDIMACSGTILCVIADKDLVIARVTGEDTAVLSRTKIGADWNAWEDTSTGTVNGSEKTPSSVLLSGNHLAVIYDYYNYSTSSGELGYSEYAAVDFFDISDPSAPVLMTSLGQDGAFSQAALDNGKMLLITQYDYTDEPVRTEPESFAPLLYSVGQKSVISPDKAVILSEGTESGCVLLGEYVLASGQRVDSLAVYGAMADPFVAEGAAYLFSSRAAHAFSRSYETQTDGVVNETAGTACTDLLRFACGDEGISLAYGTVNGSISGADCMDYDNGVLRCAVSLDQRLYSSYGSAPGKGSIKREWGKALYLLDDQFNVVGRVSDLTDADQDCWIGFLGGKAVVTEAGSQSSYLTDLTEPSLIREREALAAPVAADCIRPLGDSGFTAFYRTEAGKLSLTVYDDSLSPLSTRFFGRDHSSTLENRAGYFTDAEANIIAFSADDSYCIYGFDTEKGLYLRGDVFLQDWAWNARGFCADGYLYIVDTREIFVYDPGEFTQVTHIVL